MRYNSLLNFEVIYLHVENTNNVQNIALFAMKRNVVQYKKSLAWILGKNM